MFLKMSMSGLVWVFSITNVCPLNFIVQIIINFQLKTQVLAIVSSKRSSLMSYFKAVSYTLEPDRQPEIGKDLRRVVGASNKISPFQ